MNSILREFLTDIIDYAGLFPPAALDMRATVRNYSTYCKSEYVRWLGRLVIPVTRLEEFEEAADGMMPENRNREPEIWRLSVLAGPDLRPDLDKIALFNDRHSDNAVLIQAIEIKAASEGEIRSAMKLIPEPIVPYFEIPIADDPTELIKTIADAGGRVKVRTGGVTADAFPSPSELARFIAACAEEDVPFKATAGLHHPIRSINKLIYEPGSPTAMMHGFLNVFLAAAFAQNGMSTEDLESLLEETSPGAFQFDSGGARWRGQEVVRAHLRNTRNLLAISFGSCSFEEPIEDLKKIGLL